MIESLADDLHILIGEAYKSNSTVFLRGSDALLVDAMGSTADALQLRDWIADRGLTVRLIVMTHYFSDHMAALRLYPEAVVIAQTPSSIGAILTGASPEQPESQSLKRLR